MKKREKVIALVILVLLLTNMMVYSQVKHLKQDLNQVHQLISNVENRFSSIDNHINHTLNNIEREHQWIIDKDYKIINENEAYKNAKVSVTWMLRELEKGSQVSVLYGIKDQKTREVETWDKVEAIEKDGLNYEVNLDLSYTNNYVLQVVAENNHGIKSEKLQEIDLHDRLTDRMEIDADFQGMSPDKAEYRVDISNFYRGEEQLKIKLAQANIYLGDQLLETINLNDKAEKDRMGMGDIEFWTYSGDVALMDVLQNKDVYDTEEIYRQLKIKVTLKDQLGMEYKGESREQ